MSSKSSSYGVNFKKSTCIISGISKCLETHMHAPPPTPDSVAEQHNFRHLWIPSPTLRLKKEPQQSWSSANLVGQKISVV